MAEIRFFISICCGFVLTAAFLTPDQAYACTCDDQTLEEAIKESDAIFEGLVVRIQTKEKSDPASTSEDIVRFRVVRSWKGVREEQLVLRAARSETGCGCEFRDHQGYLVYAISDGSGLRVEPCSRTKSIEQADEDLNVLGIGEVPVSPKLTREEKQVVKTPQPPSEQAGCASCMVTKDHARYQGAFIVFLILIFAYRIQRRS
ncbi:MAG: hypothetical protein JXA30_16195 [Deltaproteobacteria bacterium]|nr:hypothetical protein [Deltaproteobacteria bacterium]